MRAMSAQQRARLNTTVGASEFSPHELAPPTISVRITWQAKLRAAYSVLTGKLMSIGDSPLADLKEQTVNANMNIGLIAALALTMVVPVLFDAALGEQTNAYMVTRPAWVGGVYFTFAASSSWALAMSSLFSILTVLVLNETSSAAESHYLVTVASAELSVPFKLTVVGWCSLVVCLLLWLVIVCFNLSAAGECAIGTSGQQSPEEACGPFQYVFTSTLVTINILSLYTIHHAINLTAKLYKCRHKMSSHLRPAAGETQGDGVDSGIVAPATRPPLDPGNYFADPDTETIWCSLRAYLTSNGKRANPLGFREFLIHQAGAGGLSYRAERLADRLFDAKISQQLADAHAALISRLDQGDASSPELAALADLPREIEL